MVQKSQLWHWVEVGAAGEVLSENQIELFEDKTLAWNSSWLPRCHTWNYAFDNICGEGIFTFEFSARAVKRKRTHIFVQTAHDAAILLSKDNELYKKFSWAPSSVMHENKNDIIIKKCGTHVVTRSPRTMVAGLEAELAAHSGSSSASSSTNDGVHLHPRP